jgi:RNA polymerase sigma-70 factor, ECF subfamily
MTDENQTDCLATGDRVCDAILVDRCRSGDLTSWEALARRWDQSLLSIAYRILGSVHDAEEVRQRVFLRMLGRPEQLPSPDAFAAWIRRTTVNEAITHFRRQDRDGRARQHACDTFRNRSVPEPADGVCAREERGRLESALGNLDPQERSIVSLRFDENLTFREIAEVLEEPASTVKSKFQRAIAKLREALHRERE